MEVVVVVRVKSWGQRSEPAAGTKISYVVNKGIDDVEFGGNWYPYSEEFEAAPSAVYLGHGFAALDQTP